MCFRLWLWNGLFLEIWKKNINAIGLEIDEVSAEKLTNKKIKFYNDINKINRII